MKLPLFLLMLAATNAFSQLAPAPERKVLEGITTTRVVQGAPYELAGRRIVFANWYYIQPGDLDWRTADGKSVYVHGNVGLHDAHHVGINAPRGIRIVAEKPQVMGPLDRPHRMILRDGNVYKGWTDSDYYESADAIHWEKKAALKFDPAIKDGLFHMGTSGNSPIVVGRLCESAISPRIAPLRRSGLRQESSYRRCPYLH